MAKPSVNVTVGDMMNIPTGILRDLAKDYDLAIRIDGGSVTECVAKMKEIKEALAPIEPKFLFAIHRDLSTVAKDLQAYAVKVR